MGLCVANRHFVLEGGDLFATFLIKRLQYYIHHIYESDCNRSTNVIICAVMGRMERITFDVWRNQIPYGFLLQEKLSYLTEQQNYL
jgi:hypothetical protein